jgi:hypothetical protein
MGGPARLKSDSELRFGDGSVVFQKKNPVTGAENDFTYQHGTVDAKTGEWRTPPGTVTHWFKLVDE